MKLRRWVQSCSTGILLLLTAGAQAQVSPEEQPLLDEMLKVLKNPPAGKGKKVCQPLNDLYFRAARLWRAESPVSAIFSSHLADLGRLRRAKGCPRGDKVAESPTNKANLLKTHRQLVADLKKCQADRCKQLEEALRTNFFTIAGVLGRDDPAVPQIIRDITVGIRADELAEELVRRIRSGQVEAKDLDDIVKLALPRLSGEAPSLLPDIAAFLRKVSAAQGVSDDTLKELFAAVLNLVADRKLSQDKLRALLAELRGIVSDDDLIHLGEALTLRRSVQNPNDWDTLRASVTLLIDIYPEIKKKMPDGLPAKPPQGAARDEVLLSLANILTNAQMVELNRLQAAKAAVSVEPEKQRRLRLLAVRRPDAACASAAAPPGCVLSKAAIQNFLVTLGSNPDGVAIVEVPGTVDDVLANAEKVIGKWRDSDRLACNRGQYGALCEWPYGGVVVVWSTVSGGTAIVHAGWRMRNEGNGVIADTAATATLSELPKASQAGAALGIEALREGTLWKILIKELPARPCVPVAVADNTSTSPPSWQAWGRVALVVATAASFLSAAYIHNTSPGSAADDHLWKVGLVSLAGLGALEVWGLRESAGGPEQPR